MKNILSLGCSWMRGFPEDRREERALGYYLGKELNLIHLNGAISSGGNDLIFDNFLNIQNNTLNLASYDSKGESVSPNNTFVVIALTEPARRSVWWEGKYGPTFRPYSDDYCDFKLPTEVNYYFSQEEIIYYNNIKNIITLYNYLKANNYKFVILQGLKNYFHTMNKFVNVKEPTFFNTLKDEFLKIKNSKEWIKECYRDWIVSNSKNIVWADNEKKVIDYSELMRLDKHPTELGAESFAKYLIETYSEKFGIKI
tara:strand:- start:9 stop:773 length:765 start_codon:yes stop_codon:yes gene_type:complete